MKAASIMERQDRRYLRARSVTASIVQVIGRLLETNPQLDRLAEEIRLLRAIDDAVMKLLTDEGIEVLTDYHRAEFGLPPRDQKGWSAEDILTYERVMLERMTQPIAPMIMSGPSLPDVPADELEAVRQAINCGLRNRATWWSGDELTLIRSFLARLDATAATVRPGE
jgi:hypothetical protein